MCWLVDMLADMLVDLAGGDVGVRGGLGAAF